MSRKLLTNRRFIWYVKTSTDSWFSIFVYLGRSVLVHIEGYVAYLVMHAFSWTLCVDMTCLCANVYISVCYIIELNMSKNRHIVYTYHITTVEQTDTKRGEIKWDQKQGRFR